MLLIGRRHESQLKSYAFWNNKGGTGKTSLLQSVTFYAHRASRRADLAIDVCPQANLSELFGGLTNDGSGVLLARQGELPRRTIGGYFEALPSPYSVPAFDAQDYICRPADYNGQIPGNIDLVAGDPLLELQSDAMSTLANTQIPGTNAWLAVLDWLRDFLDDVKDDYDTVFIDANPSFSIYTQIALSCASGWCSPCMADDSSRRAIQNAFYVYRSSSIRDLRPRLRSPLGSVKVVASASRRSHDRQDRLTQYMGPASAYAAVLRSIDTDIAKLKANEEMFTFSDVEADVDRASGLPDGWCRGLREGLSAVCAAPRTVWTSTGSASASTPST